MEEDFNVIIHPMVSDDIGNADGGSNSPVPAGANQGRSEGEAPQKTAKWRSHKKPDVPCNAACLANLEGYMPLRLRGGALEEEDDVGWTWEIGSTEELEREISRLDRELDELTKERDKRIEEAKGIKPKMRVAESRESWEVRVNEPWKQEQEARAHYKSKANPINERKWRLDSKLFYTQVMVHKNEGANEAERLVRAAEFVANTLYEPTEAEDFAENYPENNEILSIVLREAVREFKASANPLNPPGTPTLEEDEEMRMPRKEASLDTTPKKKKRKRDEDQPASEPSFGSCNIQGLEDDDVAIETGLRLALTQVARLTLEVDGAKEAREIADHIVTTAHELNDTVTALNDLWATRSPNNYGVKLSHAFPNATDLRDLGVQHGVIEEYIKEKNGKGISRVIQDAAKEIGSILKTVSERVETESESTKNTENPESGGHDGRTEGQKKTAATKRERKRKKKPPDQPMGPKQIAKRKLPTPRPQGIVISTAGGGGSYADIARRLKENIDPGDLGVSIEAIRRTKEGHLAISVGKGADANHAALKLKNAVREVLGPEVDIRSSSNSQLVEIRDISGDNEAADVYAGVCREGVNITEVTVQKLTPSYGGTQRALVALPVAVATEICKKNKIKIGWVMCRVRTAERRLERCFHCHGYGHKAAGCKGPDRSKLCMTCGGSDHLARGCTAPKHCVLCEELNKKCDHYPGSSACEAFRKAKAGRK